MFLFVVELEITFFGKEIKYVQAYNNDEAEFIAIQKTIRELKCLEENITTILVKKINRN
tara:strand:+ start:573 stop:749 length:177 start_codon:yes stop_codon:yes gene_type:complete